MRLLLICYIFFFGRYVMLAQEGWVENASDLREILCHNGVVSLTASPRILKEDPHSKFNPHIKEYSND